MQAIFLFIAVAGTALFGIVFPSLLPLVFSMSLLVLVYLAWKQNQKGFNPQSDTYKTLEKMKKKRVKKENNQHKHINDQIAYVDEVWGYTKEQKKIIKKFVESRAYSVMYNKLTASLFPQVIALIDNCNGRAKKGCKREVSRRLRELTALIDTELKKKKSQTLESFDATLEVYDQLLSELR